MDTMMSILQASLISVPSISVIESPDRNHDSLNDECSLYSETQSQQKQESITMLLLSMQNRIREIGGLKYGDDLFQDVCVKVLEKYQYENVNSDFIYMIAHNKLRDTIRKESKRSKNVVKVAKTSILHVSDTLISNEMSDKVHDCLKSLTKKQRDVIDSYFIQQEKPLQGAQRLGISQVAYRSRLKKAIKRLRSDDKLSAYGDKK